MNDPKQSLKSTYEYWEKNFKNKIAENATLKWEQIVQGVEHGYNEILKMSHLLFSPPLIFLVLCDDVERRPFVRALLKCITNHNIHLPGDMFNGDNDWSIGNV